LQDLEDRFDHQHLEDLEDLVEKHREGLEDLDLQDLEGRVDL
tara:strand:- start:292 stop:417 length:126 start_codon:yes stop_codon:yes gene_type:complete